jgi:hypothetical protein
MVHLYLLCFIVITMSLVYICYSETGSGNWRTSKREMCSWIDKWKIEYKVNMHALFVQKSQNDIHDAKRLTLHAYNYIFTICTYFRVFQSKMS